MGGCCRAAEFAGRGCTGSVICGGGLALVIARAYVGVAAGTVAGVELDEVAGDAVVATPLLLAAFALTVVVVVVLVTLVAVEAMPITPTFVGGGETTWGVLSTSLSVRNSVSSRFMTRTPVAFSSRTVGKPSSTVTLCWLILSWNSSSRNGA